MNKLLPLTFAIPLMGAALSLLCARNRVIQRAINLGCLSTCLAIAAALAARIDQTGHSVVAPIGAWSSKIGVTYLADRLSATLLVVAFATMLAVLVFAIGQGAHDEDSPFYHPAYLTLAAGLAAAFTSGDLFHLFVAFEVLLMSSYVLLTLHGGEGQIRSGTTYVVINCVESLLLLSAVGLVYAATGTVSLSELPDALATVDPGLKTGLQLMLLLAFGLKAAVFPLFFWLPDSYPTAPSPVAAVFAGLLTKVGVYAIIRTQTLLFPDQNHELLMVIAALTMVFGVLGAMAQSNMKRILSFHIVSQIGYMMMGIAIGGATAIAATMLFLIHQIPTKTSLFLVEGIVEASEGTGELSRVSGLARRSRWLAIMFAIPALSLAGLPPFSGFVGKLALVQAGIGARAWVLVATALGVSLLTLVSMSKIWIGVFWGEADLAAAPLLTSRRTMASATAALVAVCVGLALFAGPLFSYCERAANDLTTTGLYHHEVNRP